MSTPNTSRLFSVLSTTFGLVALVLALFSQPWGALGLAAMALVATGVGLLRDEGLGAIFGSGLAVVALLGPVAALSALFMGVLTTAVLSQHRRGGGGRAA